MRSMDWSRTYATLALLAIVVVPVAIYVAAWSSLLSYALLVNELGIDEQ